MREVDEVCRLSDHAAVNLPPLLLRRRFSYHATAHFVPEVAHADGLPVQRPAVGLCCLPAGPRRNCSLWIILGHPDKKPHKCRQSEGKKPLRKPNLTEKEPNYRWTPGGSDRRNKGINKLPLLSDPLGRNK